MLAEQLSSVRAVVFDFYGTLVEDEVSVRPMWECLKELGYQSSPELEAIFEPNGFDGVVTPKLRETPGYGEWSSANWRRFIRLSGVPPGAEGSVLSLLQEQQDAFRAKATPGAVAILNQAREHGLKLGLCSNWEGPISSYLRQASLPTFDGISTSCEVGARKPHPQMFLDICGKLGVKPEEAVFVGDTWSSDIVGALRTGLVPVWLRKGQASRLLTHIVAEIETLVELEGLLLTAARARVIARAFRGNH